jgi:hypothetical protein
MKRKDRGSEEKTPTADEIEGSQMNDETLAVGKNG